MLHTTALGDTGGRVVLCHGLFGQGRNWTAIAKALAEDAEQPHRVTLVDMPDHGRSSWTDGVDYVAMADAVADTVRAVSAGEPVALVGHSMGGKAAMLVALRHPEVVERLAVVDIAPADYGGRQQFEGFVAAMRSLDLERLERRAEADEHLAAHGVEDPAIRGFLLQNLRRDGDSWRWQMNLAVLGDGLAELGSWPADAVAGASYDGPVLWIGGDLSRYVRDEHAAAMDALFPRNRRVRVKNAGHWVHSEQPAVFVEVLRRFLA